jgi:predicted CoA-binding protein
MPVMQTLTEAVSEFLEAKRIAVAGVSSGNAKEEFSIGIFRKFRDAGYEAIPVNPQAKEIDGQTCYPDLSSIPGKVEGVMILTRPEIAEKLVRECDQLGIRQVWMHRSFGAGSVSAEAVDFCRSHGIHVIPGGCPMMFVPPVDFGHKCIRFIGKLAGTVPKTV